MIVNEWEIGAFDRPTVWLPAVADDADGCPAVGFGGYMCTRSLNHGGRHAACGRQRAEGFPVYAVWASEVTEPCS